MSATTSSPPVPGFLSMATFHRLTVDQYHQMIANGILSEDYPIGSAVSVVLDGKTVGTIAVADVMS